MERLLQRRSPIALVAPVLLAIGVAVSAGVPAIAGVDDSAVAATLARDAALAAGSHCDVPAPALVRPAEFAPTPEELACSDALSARPAADFDGGWSPEDIALRERLYGRLLALDVSVDEMAALHPISALYDDVVEGILDEAIARATLSMLAARFPGTNFARRAHLARARLLARFETADEASFAEATAILTRLASSPDLPIARESALLLWRIDHLRPGLSAPRLCGTDAYGNELCLDHLIGRVVVVRFWSIDDPGVRETLAADAALTRENWDHPVEVLGINRDADREAYLRAIDHFDRIGTQLYEGPSDPRSAPSVRARRARQTSSYSAWRETSSGGTYLIGPAGRIRAVGVDGDELRAAIEDALTEIYSRRRSAQTTASGDPASGQGR